MRFLLRIFLLLCLCFWTSQLGFAEGQFSDLENSKYRESILDLADIGVINGYDDGTFKPKKSVNRAELLKMIFQALDHDAEKYPGNCFPDVTDQWFAPYVCQAKDFGIVKGYDDGYFRPDTQANMVESLKIVVKAFDLPVEDLKEDQEWYKPYVDFVHNNNVFSKYSYLPAREAKREEIAYLVDQILEIQLKETFISSERDYFSEGCRQPAPSSPPDRYIIDGIEREAIVAIPENYDPNKPLSLIFAFHGRTNSNARVQTYYGIEKASGGEAIVVYPAGIQKSSGYTWSDGGDPAGDLRDYQFFDVMLEEISSRYCVNMDEIYAVGHSLGGWFTNSLACARGDVLRAVASLGGSRTNSACSGPVAVMQWHNPNDRLASFSSAEVARDWFVQQNQCSYKTVPINPLWGNCVAYQECNQSSPVIWCPHTEDYDSRGIYYPHNWPKGVGKEMWNFFKSLD